MDLTNPIDFIITLISFIASVGTIITIIFPNETYPFISWIRNKFNKRLFSKQSLSITLYKNYFCDEITVEDFKRNLKSAFSDYGFRSEYENGILAGNLNRMNFHIELIIDDPTIHNDFILVKQISKVKFKDLNKLINVMFDLYDDFQKIDFIKEYDNQINFIIGSDKFANNKFIKEFGDNIHFNDFAVNKFKNKYELNITAVNNQESIKKVNDIIIGFIEI